MKRSVRVVLGVVVVLVIVTATGLMLLHSGGASVAPSEPSLSSSAEQASSGSGAPAAATPMAADGASGKSTGSTRPGAPASSSNAAATPVAQPMIVTTSTLALRVKDVPASIEALRKLAAASGAQVAALTYVNGSSDDTPIDAPQAALSAGSTGQPSNAEVTLRVPAAKLDALTRAAMALGTVSGQTENQSDVTAQHVDLAARLKNLRAEEARLRTLFARAGDVSDLLEVEQELASVRGEIESAQAQLAYLDSQVALSTLTVSLAQPGALVRPTLGVSWGLADAVTAGVQSAVGLTRAFITGAIALIPIALLLLLAWGAVRLARRARAKRGHADADAPTNT